MNNNSLLILLFLYYIVSGQILIDVDKSYHPNLVISDMNYNNYTLEAIIGYDQSSAKAAIDICLYIERVYNVQIDEFAECIDDVGRKVLYSRQNTNYSKNLKYQMINNNNDNNNDNDNNHQIKIEINNDGDGTNLIDKHNYIALQKEYIIAPNSNNMCTKQHIDINKEIVATTLYKENPTISRYNGIGAIVILAQAGQHSTYKNFNALKELKKTLNLLYKNYNDHQKDDIWIFHEGDFTKEIQNEVRANRSEIRFYHLKDENWDVFPSFIRGKKSKKTRISYSLGYRFMIRWYSIRIWNVMNQMGYTWVLRLDDDSGILSPIKFNVFHFMETNGYQYAYRVVAVESPDDLFYDFIQSNVIKENISNVSQLFDTCELKESLADYNYFNCGMSPGYYTNFFVTNVSRWLEPDVQSFLQAYDETGMIFLLRWGDLEIQSAIVRILFPEDKIFRFTSFSYSHFSGDQQKAVYGILQTGLFEEDQEKVITEFAYNNNWEDNISENIFMIYGMLSYSKNFCNIWNSSKTNESCLC